MSTIEKLQRTHNFPTIRVQTPPDGSAHWLYMHADAGQSGVRPCCRFEMLEDMWSYMSSITLRESQRHQAACATSCLLRPLRPTTSAVTSSCSAA